MIRQGPGQNTGHAWIYWLVTILSGCLTAIPARVRILRIGELPAKGGCLLAFNHISHFDPPILTIRFRRRIDWLAMADLFRTTWSAWIFFGVGAIPVDRNGADRTAARTAIQRLRQGRVVGIFPEGGIRDGERSIVNGAPMQPGVAMIAVHAGVPVVPVVILGTERLYNPKRWLPWRRAPVWIAVGTPIPLPVGLPRDEARDKLLREMSAAFTGLRDVLREKFSLTNADMPHSPQERMKEP